MISEFAPAKINLFLHVTGRRPDGYHELQSLFGFCDVGDRLTFAPSEELTLEIIGPFSAGLDAGADNLVIKAAKALRGKARVAAGAAITLEKNLPLSSGIGGGSGDAAAVLRGLDKLWGLSLSGEELHDLALSLGADVPSCVLSEGVFVSGVGEHLCPSRLGISWPIVLVNPGCGVSTPEVFGRFKEMGMAFSDVIDPWPPAWHGEGDARQGIVAAGNDLEAPALDHAPAIAEVLGCLSSLDGAWLSRMSGSGATCFALMDNDVSAEKARAHIQEALPPAWVALGRVEV